MTRTLDGEVCEVGLQVSRWTIEGAAAPTTVVLAQSRVPDPVAVLEAVAASSPASVRKLALVEPADDGDAFDAHYTFVELVRADGHAWLDLTAECGHSMLAASAQLLRAQRRPGPVTVRLSTGRSGRRRVVTCTLRELGVDDYTASVRFPVDPAAAHPLGRHPVRAGDLSAVVVDCGNPYAFVDAAQLGISTPEALFAAGNEVRLPLLEVRRWLAPALGVSRSFVLPKPAVALRISPTELFVRAVSVDDWHPALALTGLVASAAFMDRWGAGDPAVRIASPRGTTTVRCETVGDDHVVVVSDRTVRGA